MDALEIREAWDVSGEQLIAFGEEALTTPGLPDTAIEFLRLAGLPEDAAPFLSFRAPARGPLPTAGAEWAIGPEFDGYYIIGANGSGDPVVIASSGGVYYLNHDAGFRPTYINKDLQTFGEALVRFQRLIAEAQRVGGEDAYLDRDIPEALKSEFRAFLLEHDAEAISTAGLWSEEMALWTS